MKLPVVVGYAVIIACFNAPQVHAQLGLVHVELGDEALGLEHVKAQQGESVASSGLRKS